MNKKDIAQLNTKLKIFCEKSGARYTPPRRLTLEVIAASHKPISAYDVIEEIAKIADKPKPTTVYRAIEFLQKNGFVHKIESLNAFLTCQEDHTHRGSQFIICDDCGTVEEIHLCHLPPSLQSKVNGTGFEMAHWNTEIHGTCEDCRS